METVMVDAGINAKWDIQNTKQTSKALDSEIRLLLLLLLLLFLLSYPILPGNSLEPTVIPTGQASSFTLQYFPYYV
jgi:hypothetical protein